MKQTVKNLVSKAKKTAICASTMAMTMPFTAMASGGDGFFEDHGITVNPDVSPMDMVNKMINIVAGMFIIMGLFMVTMAIFKWLEAHSEDNSAAQTKAIRQICIGAAFIGAPALLIFLFS